MMLVLDVVDKEPTLLTVYLIHSCATVALALILSVLGLVPKLNSSDDR